MSDSSDESLMTQPAPRLSLNVRLPLFFACLMLVVIVIFAALTYRTAAQTAIATSSARLGTVAAQLSGLVAQQVTTGARPAVQLAKAGVIQAYANGAGGADQALAALQAISTDTSAGSALELRDETGALRLSARPSTSLDSAAARAAPPRPDSTAITGLYRVGNDIYFELVVPVRRRTGPSWHLVARDRIGDPKGNRSLAAVLGTDARILIGNRDGTLWADLGAPAESSLISGAIRNGEYRRDGQARMAATAEVAGTPLQIAAELSRAEALRGTQAMMAESAWIALLVLLAGTLLGWLLSRRLTRPLVRLTHEAEALARSNGEAASVPRSGDELARLSDAFGTMVTRVRQGQEQLRLSEAQYRMLFDLNPNPMWVFDRATLQFLAVNDAAVRKYGYSHDEFVAMTLRDIRPDEDVPQLEEAVQVDWDARPDATSWRHRTRDGTVFDVEIRGRPVTFLGHDAELVLASDVSERNRLEARLRQAQKMEAVGRLAGGIAHDFNNILSAVLGYSNLVLEDLPADDPRRPDVEEISESGMRGAALTRQLLMFSRPQVAERQVLDMNAIVIGVRKMLERIIGEDIKIETRLASDLGRVRMDPGHLEQIIMNLAVNARDAMPGGGRLTIETAAVELDELTHRGSRLLPAGRYVMLAVSDVGVGISKEHQARIFEPFFSTKPPGEGTGLGLSTVYGIVQQNGGSVLVYSEVGHGATFKVYLPRVEDPATVRAEMAGPPARGSAREMVLFVEDEPSLLRVGCEILTRAGYTVIGMPGPEEAIAYAAAHPEHIDLVATDMVMPGLSGRELANRIRAARPLVRVLFMSGYTDDAVMQRGVLEPHTAFLQKPFSAEGLARKVRAVLDGAADGPGAPG
jgi:PAS domain S-box-containing protein